MSFNGPVCNSELLKLLSVKGLSLENVYVSIQTQSLQATKPEARHFLPNYVFYLIWGFNFVPGLGGMNTKLKQQTLVSALTGTLR